MRHRVRQRDIHALLDGRLGRADRGALEQHLAGCRECASYRDGVAAARETMRGIASASPPPVDWHRVEEGLAAAKSHEARRGLGALTTWGALAAAAAAALLVTWGLSEPAGGPAPERPGAAGAQPATEPREAPVATAGGGDAPATVEAFVTFVAGEAVVSTVGTDTVRPLALEEQLEVGTRLRTGPHGAAGLQLGPGRACRLAPATEVVVADLGTRGVEVELVGGEIVCDGDGADGAPALVVSTVDLVASAVDRARFAVRRAPRVVVVELAEGSLHVSPDALGGPLDGPGRLTFRTDAAGRREDGSVAREALAAVVLPVVPTIPRRSIASLTIPALAAVDSVLVDGVDYGALPLSLRRRPGLARIELLAAGRAPVVHEVSVGLGPRFVEIDMPTLDPSAMPSLAPAPTERRVAPKIGTYTAEQVRRLRTQVGSKVRGCYERTLKRNPSVWGRIRVQLTVSTSGEPRAVRVSSIAGGHDDVNRCIEGAIGDDRFPPPAGGHVPVEQVITLSPQF
jgi:anti-sigma factor RsiW